MPRPGLDTYLICPFSNLKLLKYEKVFYFALETENGNEMINEEDITFDDEVT